MSTAIKALGLSDAQAAQQIDLTRRMLHMAALGTPRFESSDPDSQQVLALHAFATAYLALAQAHPGITATAADLAYDMGDELALQAARQAGAAH